MNNPTTQSSHASDHGGGHHNDRRLVQYHGSCGNLCSDEEAVQFRPHQEAMGSDDSGVCSPPLWKGNPSPSTSPSQPLLSHHVHSSLSPNSRLKAIARGQRELMEMVKSMPESSYELSLKDLVDHQEMEAQAPQLESVDSPNKQSLQQRGVGKVKRQESNKNEKYMVRSRSLENHGLFLKTVFPLPLHSKKRKNFASIGSGKVSPKPEVVKGGGERDWWKKKFTGSSDSDSRRRSNNSGGGSSSGTNSGRSNSGRKKNGFLSGCWSFFRSRRSKSVEKT